MAETCGFTKTMAASAFKKAHGPSAVFSSPLSILCERMLTRPLDQSQPLTVGVTLSPTESNTQSTARMRRSTQLSGTLRCLGLKRISSTAF